MADPLSIAAGVAGVLSLGISVCNGLIEYYQKYSSRTKNIARTVDSLKGLCTLLEKLQSTLNVREASAERTADMVRQSILSCLEAIEELRTELRKITDASSKIVAGIKKLTYPLRESTLAKQYEIVQDVRDALSLAINVLNLEDTAVLHDELRQMKALSTSLHHGK